MNNQCHYYCCDINKTISVDCVTMDIPEPLSVIGTIQREEVNPCYASLDTIIAGSSSCTDFVLNNGEQFQKPENVTVTDDAITFTSQGYTITVPLCNMEYIVK